VNYGDKLDVIWDNTRKFRNLGYDYFVFNHDSLLFWTSNQVAFSDNRIIQKGRNVILLENGWYYKSTRKSDGFSMVGLFLIKHEFPYENENLINSFNEEFEFYYDAKLESISDEYNIRFPNGDFAFSLSNLEQS